MQAMLVGADTVAEWMAADLGTTTVIFGGGGGTVIVDESFVPQLLLVLVDRHMIAIATYLLKRLYVPRSLGMPRGLCYL